MFASQWMTGIYDIYDVWEKSMTYICHIFADEKIMKIYDCHMKYMTSGHPSLAWYNKKICNISQLLFITIS